MINNEPNELTLIYHSEKMDDRKALAFVKAFNRYHVKSLDLSKDNITPTQLAEIADKMNVPLIDLIDKTYQEKPIQDEDKFKDYDDDALLTIMVGDKMLIATPLIIIGNQVYHYGTSYELIKKDLEILGAQQQV